MFLLCCFVISQYFLYPFIFLSFLCFDVLSFLFYPFNSIHLHFYSGIFTFLPHYALLVKVDKWFSHFFNSERSKYILYLKLKDVLDIFGLLIISILIYVLLLQLILFQLSVERQLFKFQFIFCFSLEFYFEMFESNVVRGFFESASISSSLSSSNANKLKRFCCLQKGISFPKRLDSNET